MEKTLSQLSKFAPLIGFFILYHQFDLLMATAFLIAATAILTLLQFVLFRKMEVLPLVAAFFVAFFGGLTLIFKDPIYIMIKPTLLNIALGAALLISAFIKKPILKLLLNKTLLLPDYAWTSLSIRYAILFILLAVLNEWAWRVMGEAFWVNFKLFGLLGISILFSLLQTPYILRHQLPQTP